MDNMSEFRIYTKIRKSKPRRDLNLVGSNLITHTHAHARTHTHTHTHTHTRTHTHMRHHTCKQRERKREGF